MINEIKEAMKKVHKHGWSNFNDVSCEDCKFVAEYDNLRECQGGLIAISETVEDATFIANTPTYIRYLLDELEKAQERVEITNKAMESALGLIRDLENELQGIRNVANDGLKHGDEYRMNISLSSIKMAVDEIFDDEEDAPDEQN